METFLADPPVPVWTGRLRFGLFNTRNWPVGDAEVVIRLDTVMLYFAERALAVMSRDRFRAWLTCPQERYEVDDVVWDGEGDPQAEGSARLIIDGRRHCWVENISISVLTGLI